MEGQQAEPYAGVAVPVNEMQPVAPVPYTGTAPLAPERDGPTQRMSLLFDLLPPRDYLLQTRASQIRQRPLELAARQNSCYYDRAFFERSIHIHSSVSESKIL